jgi:hypothetical protein
MDLDSDYYSSRCKDINGLWVFKGTFYDVCGCGQWSLNTILFKIKGVVYTFGVEMLLYIYIYICGTSLLYNDY